MTTPSDRWLAGEAYESFMGRWSRPVAGLFLDWLALPSGLNWLDVGCGTGALSEAICKRVAPQSIVGCDPSPDFVSFARNALLDCPAAFVVAGADNLPGHEGGFGAIVSGLVLNFLPEPLVAVHSMAERLRHGGTVAAYVWDYAEGMQFLKIFWEEAAALNPPALELDEARRFPLCQPDRLADLFRRGGLSAVQTTSLQIDTVFPSFEAFWKPFLAGTGPAPTYVATLEAGAQDQLAQRLSERLQASAGRPIRLSARAFAVRGLRTT